MASWDLVLSICADRYYYLFKKHNKKDLVEFCLKNKGVRNSIEIFLKSKREISLSKNSKAAEKAKKEGDLKFKKLKFDSTKEDYMNVISSYSLCIAHSNDKDECLSLAYWSRSLLLLQIGYILEALQDINIALSLDYPENKTEDFLKQKCKCLLLVGAVVDAKKIYCELSKEQQTNVSIDSLQREVQNLKNMEMLSPEICETPQVAGGCNENFASASAYLQVHYEKSKGRHVIASEDIQMGEVLFVEKPYAFVLLKKEFCGNCCKKLVAPIPCLYCADASYCSPNCRDTHWKSIHFLECGSNEVFKCIGIAHLSLRIVLTAFSSLDELKNAVHNMNNPEYQEGIIPRTNQSYDTVYNLVTNYEKYEETDLFQYTMAALLLALHLKYYTTFFGNSAGVEDLKFLTKVLQRHILQLICNGHAIVGTFLESFGEGVVENESEERIGTAIYPSASMMNHSCEPSVINSFYNNCLVVRAVKDIKKGEEVYNCYGTHARRMERAERHKILSQQYFFDCKCNACLLQPYDIQDKFSALKCESCKGPLIAKVENENYFCADCKEVFDMTLPIAKKQEQFFEQMKEGMLFSDIKAGAGLNSFIQSWLIGREIFYKFNKNLAQAADEVAKCLAFTQNYKMCIMFLRCCILSVEKRYGSNSIELANELKKLADALHNYVNVTVSEGKEARKEAMEGVGYYEKAQSLISLFLGSNHPSLKEIERNKAHLEVILKE